MTRLDGSGPLDFGRGFVHSEAFKALFQEGMELVEEAAAYLDGPGRVASRDLPATVAVSYAKESMRLTSQLMQIASWLLVQRAWAEGDLSHDQVVLEKNRLRISATGMEHPPEDFDRLPQRLRALVGLAARLHARILHLELLLAEGMDEPPMLENPVAAQRLMIEEAFRAPR